MFKVRVEHKDFSGDEVSWHCLIDRYIFEGVSYKGGKKEIKG